MTIFELAQKYYPRLWTKERLGTLVKVGQLTRGEYRELTKETWKEDSIS